MKRLIAVAALGLTASCTLTPVDSHIHGYLTSPRGALLKNADNQCWRTAAWKPEFAIAECDPEVVAALAEEELPVEEPEKEDVPEVAAEETVVADTAAPAVVDRAEVSQRVRDILPLPLHDDIVIVEERPVVLSGDANFHFGQSYLTPRGREAVQFLANAIQRQKMNNQKIEIVGHSDRTGRRELNMKISEDRALAVKKALVEMGIPAANISTVGKGPDHPVTDLTECPQGMSLYELIGCLVADRRVEIRVTGVAQINR